LEIVLESSRGRPRSQSGLIRHPNGREIGEQPTQKMRALPMPVIPEKQARLNIALLRVGVTFQSLRQMLMGMDAVNRLYVVAEIIDRLASGASMPSTAVRKSHIVRGKPATVRTFMPHP
jgi:hypothetical protein